MKKKEVIKLRSPVPHLRCGECLHFKGQVHANKGELCSKAGVRSGAAAPACFTPNFPEVLQDSSQLMSIMRLMQQFNPKQRRILATVLMAKPRKGVVFGQKVYFLAVGKNYLSNYLSGYVVGNTSTGSIVVMGDPDTKSRGKVFLGLFDGWEDLYTPSKFKLVKEALKAKGRIEDPDAPLMKSKKPITFDYEPPTIDSAFKKPSGKKKKGQVEGVDKKLARFVVV